MPGRKRLEKPPRVTESTAWGAGFFGSLIILAAVAGTGGCSTRTRVHEAQGSTVVLLHGLSRTSRAMEPLAEFLADQGYRVVNIDYPSRDRPVEELAGQLRSDLDRCCRDASRLDFVTHSLGGIVLRRAHTESPIGGLGRVVMLGPPNDGSELVDFLGATGARLLLGPAGAELGTDSESVPSQLAPVDFPLGVIAGSRTINPLYSAVIPGPDDGKVSVERAKISGMLDFLVLPHSHTFIMRSPKAHRQTLYFLRHGRFERPPED